LTRQSPSPHSRGVLSFGHRFAIVLLAVALVGGQTSVCAGWAATPEARMACCAEGGHCPMHRAEPHDLGSGRVLTQIEADNCCAASEREESSPSAPTFVATISPAVLGPGVVLPASVPARVLSDNWRTVTPVPTTPVPRHVLLSVFLV
jgi:hypothetical protein